MGGHAHQLTLRPYMYTHLAMGTFIEKLLIFNALPAGSYVVSGCVSRRVHDGLAVTSVIMLRPHLDLYVSVCDPIYPECIWIVHTMEAIMLEAMKRIRWICRLLGTDTPFIDLAPMPGEKQRRQKTAAKKKATKRQKVVHVENPMHVGDRRTSSLLLPQLGLPAVQPCEFAPVPVGGHENLLGKQAKQIILTCYNRLHANIFVRNPEHEMT